MTARKILVPVDGSPCALRALDFAARRVRGNPHEQLLVLFAQLPLPASRFVTRTMIAEHHARMAEEALKPARALLDKLGVEADFYALKGEPGATIAAFARKSRASEIVMGSRGLGRVAGLFLGSVTTKVVHLSGVPVTIVK